jgi:hypothetical protein
MLTGNTQHHPEIQFTPAALLHLTAAVPISALQQRQTIRMHTGSEPITAQTCGELQYFYGVQELCNVSPNIIPTSCKERKALDCSNTERSQVESHMKRARVRMHISYDVCVCMYVVCLCVYYVCI